MTMKVDDIIRSYVALRQRKADLEAKVKEEVADIRVMLGKLEGWIQARAEQEGVTSFKTPHGTAFLTTTDYAQVADWDATLAFIKDTENFHMLDKRVSKVAVREYMEETGEVPPGVTYGTRLGVNVRKPTKI